MPAGHGKKCPRCYWGGLFQRRLSIDLTAFSTSEMRKHFKAFGDWLVQHNGERMAALKIHRYLPFFMDIERQWGTIPRYEALLTAMGPEKLRRVQLPMKWMQHSAIIAPTNEAKLDDSERRQITAILDAFKKDSADAQVLTHYHQICLAKLKSGKSTLRSVRLALLPASKLLRLAKEMNRSPPDQDVLSRYLSRTPGQRAAVTGFINFLRINYEVKLTLPRADSKNLTKKRRQKLEKQLTSLMQHPSNTAEFKQKWMATSLAYFHNVSLRTIKHLLFNHIEPRHDGLIITSNNESYWIPGYPVHTHIGNYELKV